METGMNISSIFLCLAILICFASSVAMAITPDKLELKASRVWVDQHIGPRASDLPFSFIYNGKSSSELLKIWDKSRTSRKLDAHRTQETLTWTDPATKLVVRCEAIIYLNFPTVEWTLYFKNTGASDTPIIENIQALDTDFINDGSSEFLLHHNVGSPANRSDYAPQETSLGPDAHIHISAAGGRPTNSDWSYFNLATGNEGTIIVVGWPGQWASDFMRDPGKVLHVTAGQELTHFLLHSGEEVRTPLILLQSWKGDWIRGQNLWRRWMMAYGMPHPAGTLPQPQMLASSSRAYGEMIGADEANQIMHIDRYIDLGFKLNVWWMDAGWYPQEHGWPQVGTWETDKIRFPNGFKTISDYAHEKGVKILVWFEPERVAADTWLSNNHPEWILGGKNGGLLNLGNAEAWNWLVHHMDKFITDNGIDIYRQDFNMDPLSFWRSNDTPDRQGITEIKHVTGYLAYWDELRKRYPNMLIDSCASGGRRNDLETMRRAVPLWRSDYAYEPIGQQCMSYGISMWLPYFGTGTVACAEAGYYGSGVTPVEPYAFWSCSVPGLGCGVDVRQTDIDYTALRKLFSEWRSISPYYYGDYYPLTSYSQADNAYLAWQFNRPNHGDGVVQAFRRAKCEESVLVVKLQGLSSDARYEVRDIDGRTSQEIDGKELMKQGLQISFRQKPGAEVIIYKKR
jgi:alpha-galactosidase